LVDELDRFEALLADLLEISRLDAGVADLAAEVADIRGVVRRVAESLRPIANKAGVTLELLLPDEELDVEFDPRRVERILRNLLANAIDHGDGKPVEVWVAGNADAV